MQDSGGGVTCFAFDNADHGLGVRVIEGHTFW